MLIINREIVNYENAKGQSTFKTEQSSTVPFFIFALA